jgi:hypothetical protein
VLIEQEKEEKHGPLLRSDVKEVGADELDPWMMYLYAMKSPATKEKYVMRLGRFLDFVNHQEANKDSKLEDEARVFAKRGRDDRTWAFNNIIRFIQLQKDRFIRKEITAGTIRNYVKSIKLFCQMADVSIAWEKITRGLCI